MPEQPWGSDYGPFGQVVETLPPGFSYEGSDLSEAVAVVEGQTVAFTLLGDERFTYAVAASRAEGSYSFSGVLLAEAGGLSAETRSCVREVAMTAPRVLGIGEPPANSASAKGAASQMLLCLSDEESDALNGVEDAELPPSSAIRCMNE